MKILEIARLIAALLVMSSATHAQVESAPVETDPLPTIAAASFEPSRPVTGDKLKLKVKLGANALRAEVQWSVNGEEVQLSDIDEFNQSAELDRVITAGDRIDASIKPFDAEGVTGRSGRKQIVVGNAVPAVKLGNQKIVGDVYSAKLEVVDPEGEEVSLRLKNGPKGMKISPDGLITWKFGKDTNGKFDVKVSAKDKRGAEAIIMYSFTIKRSGT
jgi:hypothetical protein